MLYQLPTLFKSKSKVQLHVTGILKHMQIFHIKKLKKSLKINVFVYFVIYIIILLL